MAGGGADGAVSFSGSRAKQGRVTSRARGGFSLGGGLMLASMLDILMAILFFLLKNYSAAISDFSMGKDITLPQSSATMPPMPSLQLVVTQKSILLDDKEIAILIDGQINPKDLYKDGLAIIPLVQALKKQKDRSLFIEKHNDEHSFNGAIVMQADKNLPFSVLKKIIYSAGVSDFVMFKLAVLKKDQS